MLHQELLLEPNENGIQYAAELLNNGDVVAFPTETVYGLGANAFNEEAVQKIFSTKNRPLTDPLIVHVAGLHQALLLTELTQQDLIVVECLVNKFWPGPLTIILKASSALPLLITAGTGYVGIRQPSNEIAQMLIAKSGLPIAAPSANRFGHVSPTKAQHVLDDLGEKGVYVINGESPFISCKTNVCNFGIESTVVKLDMSNNQLIIVRQGAISQVDLEHEIVKQGLQLLITSKFSVVKMDHSKNTGVKNNEIGQEAPGQAVTHYAPNIPCFVVKSYAMKQKSIDLSTDEVSPINEQSVLISMEMLSKSIIIDYNGMLQNLKTQSLAYKDLSVGGIPLEAAQVLFDTLRWAENIQNAERVFIATIDSRDTACEMANDIRLGVADRIFRAASGKVIELVVHS